jgi:hypothetical protein
VEIDIDPRPITPGSQQSSAHCALGRIVYPEQGAEPGLLLYLKSSITGDEPADVEEYRRKNPEFPQQPTLDQFFSESQFEAYRELGFHVCQSVLDGLEPEAGIDELFKKLSDPRNLKPAACGS